MAGYKATVFQDEPVAFWTFDLDRSGLNGNTIIDEIDNMNPLSISSGDEYYLEQQSLNDLEVVDQYSCSFAKFGRNDYDYSKHRVRFECIHSTAFDFFRHGSFSIEFLYYKETPGVIREYGQPGWTANIESPIIKKGNMMRCYVRHGYYSDNHDLIFSMFSDSRTVTCDNNTEYPIFNRVNHVVLVYDVKQIDVNEYLSEMKLYVNGALRGKNTRTYLDNYPLTTVPDSWLIASKDGTNPVTDWNRELLKLDQVAIYNYALDEVKISNHYRKLKDYDTLIRDDYPKLYWRMNEIYDPSDDTMYARVGGLNGKYYGTVDKYNPGPDKIIDAHAPKFNGESSVSVEHYNTSGAAIPLININQDYTMEFWFRTAENKRTVLLSCVEENQPWDGLVIWLNTKNHQHSPGNIQVQENMNNYVSTRDLNPTTGVREVWNDDKWHHLLVRRRGINLELWLDGELNSSNAFSKRSNSKPSQLHIMGMAPGKFSPIGYMCELAYYDYAFQDMQIQHRWLFTTRYKIHGYTLLQGNPIRAAVRFYDHITGELKGEVESDSVTGEYIFYSFSNRYLDVLSFIPDNNTTRYRVHGPVKPAEYDDNHINP